MRLFIGVDFPKQVVDELCPFRIRSETWHAAGDFLLRTTCT